MRQRGAGSRAVNADFGFSFAGFSAPTSQEATPTTCPREPPVKRRKTIAQESAGDQEQERPRSNCRDGRGRTKAARAKKMFVVEADEESKRSKGVGVGDGDDSFVAEIGAKRRKDRGVGEVDEDGQAHHHDAANGNAKPAKRPRAKRAPVGSKGKAKVQRDAVPAMDGVDETVGEVEAVKEPEPAAKTTSRTRRTSREMEADNVDVVSTLQLESGLEQASMHARPKPKPKRRAAKETEMELFTEQHSPTLEQQPVEAEPAAGTRYSAKKRTARGLQNEASRRLEDLTVGQHDGEDVLEVATKMFNGRPKAKGQVPEIEHSGPFVELGHAIGPSDNDTGSFAAPARSTARKRKTQTGQDQAPPKSASSAFHKGKEACEAILRPAKKSRAAKKIALESTPPQLQRRPLQETDANRSPSPRKSPEKPTNEANVEGRGKGTKRKRKATTDCEEIHQQSSRKGRNLRVQADEPSTGDDVVLAEADDRHRDADVEAIAVPEALRGDTKDATTRQRQSKALKASRPNETRLIGTTHPRDTSKEQGDVEREEDIDWLFAAPGAKPKAAPKVPVAAKSSGARRKAKLADIDLDDLIANVAALAQSGDPGTASNALGTAANGQTRKRRRV